MSSTVNPTSAPSDAATNRAIEANSARNGTVTSTRAEPSVLGTTGEVGDIIGTLLVAGGLVEGGRWRDW